MSFLINANIGRVMIAYCLLSRRNTNTTYQEVEGSCSHGSFVGLNRLFLNKFVQLDGGMVNVVLGLTFTFTLAVFFSALYVMESAQRSNNASDGWCCERREAIPLYVVHDRADDDSSEETTHH